MAGSCFSPLNLYTNNTSVLLLFGSFGFSYLTLCSTELQTQVRGFHALIFSASMFGAVYSEALSDVVKLIEPTKHRI